MSKELVISNVKQFHCETDGHGNLALWVETIYRDNPLKDVRVQEKESLTPKG